MIGVHGAEPVVQEPAPQAATPTAVLTAPARIEAIAGQTISLPIALDGTDGVPPRSVLAIKKPACWRQVLRGSPLWRQRMDSEAGSNRRSGPGRAGRCAMANSNFAIALIAPDDKVIAEAEALLAIAARPSSLQASVAQHFPRTPMTTAASGTEPEEGDGGAATMEAATTPAGEAPPEVEQTQAATAPSVDSQPNALGQAEDGDNGLGTVEPSVFVNMREGPASSSPVLGVIAKGAKLPVLDRKRGWVQVTDPATAKTGWIYSGLARRRDQDVLTAERRAAPRRQPEPKSESFWGRVGGLAEPVTVS